MCQVKSPCYVSSEILHLARNIFALLTTSQLSKDKEIQPPQNRIFFIHNLAGPFFAFFGWCLFKNDDVIKGDSEESERNGLAKEKEQEEEEIGFS